MSRVIRRTLATVSDAKLSAVPSSSSSTPSPLRNLRPGRTPQQALAVSRTTTAPLASTRRRKLFPDAPIIKRGTSPEQEKRFQAARAAGQLPGSEPDARREFLRGQNEWRSRIRGHRQVLRLPKEEMDEDGEEVTQKAGAQLSSRGRAVQYEPNTIPPSTSLSAQRIYLPNIQIRLMRNHTPPGQPYDTSIATFRIPPSMTKTDLRSYLFAVYGLTVTFIRTDNYLAPVARTPLTGRLEQGTGSKKNYKRATVGLTEPFHYPDDVDELNAIIAYDPSTSTSITPAESSISAEENSIRRERALLGKEKREQWMNSQFMVDLQDSGKKRSMMKLGKGVRWRSKTHDNDGNTVRAIMKKRREEERAIEEAVRNLDLNEESRRSEAIVA